MVFVHENNLGHIFEHKKIWFAEISRMRIIMVSLEQSILSLRQFFLNTS